LWSYPQIAERGPGPSAGRPAHGPARSPTGTSAAPPPLMPAIQRGGPTPGDGVSRPRVTVPSATDHSHCPGPNGPVSVRLRGSARGAAPPGFFRTQLSESLCPRRLLVPSPFPTPLNALPPTPSHPNPSFLAPSPCPLPASRHTSLYRLPPVSSPLSPLHPLSLPTPPSLPVPHHLSPVPRLLSPSLIPFPHPRSRPGRFRFRHRRRRLPRLLGPRRRRGCVAARGG
jgi:hypothetical protein